MYRGIELCRQLRDIYPLAGDINFETPIKTHSTPWTSKTNPMSKRLTMH